MVSARSKGMRNEKEFQVILESEGYVVERVKGGTKWNKQTDFFGLWDLLCFMPGKHWLLVQIKTDYRKKVYDDLKAWFDKNNPPNTKVLYAIRRKEDDWRKEWIK